MKLFTGLALGSVLIAGSACSEPASPASAQSADTATESTQTVQLAEPEGTFNLSLPGSMNEPAASSGLNLSFGEPADDGLLTGQEGFGEADFGTAPDIDLGMPDDTPSASEDDIIRLPSK